jgi:two-component system response regulator GlrR
MSTDTSTATPRSLRILVVDDDTDVGEAIAMVLRREGHVVDCAPSGRDAIDHLEAGASLDVVLTDLGMPDVNGWVVARTAKERQPTMAVGLITGWGDDDSLGSATERSIVDFVLTKPVDRRTLADALARATQRPLAA